MLKEEYDKLMNYDGTCHGNVGHYIFKANELGCFEYRIISYNDRYCCVCDEKTGLVKILDLEKDDSDDYYISLYNAKNCPKYYKFLSK